MKIFYFALLILTTAAMIACDDDNEPNTGDIVVENQAQLRQSVFANSLAGESDIRFTTTGAWTSAITEVENTKSQALKSVLATKPNWISISPDAGTQAGNYVISVNLTENLTKVDRTATITIVCGDTQITITITQKATKEDGTMPEDKRGGVGKFILTDYYSEKVLGQVDVDEAKLDGNHITFYNGGTPIDIYLYMSDLEVDRYDWCEYNCTGNYFYTQKGITDGFMWYAKKGAVELSKQDEIYTISVFLDTDKDYQGSDVRIAINGTYRGYLTAKD